MDLVCKHCGSNACVQRERERVILLNCTVCGLPSRVYRRRHGPSRQTKLQEKLHQIALPLEPPAQHF